METLVGVAQNSVPQFIAMANPFEFPAIGGTGFWTYAHMPRMMPSQAFFPSTSHRLSCFSSKPLFISFLHVLPSLFWASWGLHQPAPATLPIRQVGPIPGASVPQLCHGAGAPSANT